MNELIKIENRDGVETVNARELHEFLESGTRFNDWIQRRIEKYGFQENVDFTVVTQKRVTDGKAYFITIDMAKELSMVENNERGREARQYFIFMERRAKVLLSQTNQVQTELEMAERTVEVIQWQQQRIGELKTENGKLRIKANVVDAIVDSEGLILLSDAGKQICGHPIKFIQWAEDSGLLFRRKKGSTLLPKAEYDKKYFRVNSRSVDGYLREQVYLTPRGLVWITAKYNQAHGLLDLQTRIPM